MNDWETALVDAFIVPAKRERYKMLLGNPRYGEAGEQRLLLERPSRHPST